MCYLQVVARPLYILEGRRFSCTRCGNCCAKDGLVFITPEEIEAMAHHLQMSVERFWAEFAVRYDAAAEQAILEAKNGKGCPLLDSEAGCRVHPVKPSQCRSFPFWPELLEDAQDWEDARNFCPGMDSPKGRHYTKAEIVRIRDEGIGT